MTLLVKPIFQSPVADNAGDTAANKVTPTRWNQGSAITMATARLIGRVTALDGDAEELTAAQVQTMLGLTPGTAAGNVVVLDGSGLLPVSTLPALALVDTNVVATQAAMLALTAQKGDIAIRTDIKKTYVLSTNSPSTLADWLEMLTPTDLILSVAGLTGVITGAGLKTALAITVADITNASANGRSLISAADYSAMRTLLTLVPGTDIQAYDADTAKTDVAQSWLGPQRSTIQALTSATTITPDAAQGNDYSLTLAHNATLANFSNIGTYIGMKGTIAAVQDATGGRTLAYGSFWFPIGAATAPAIPSVANAKFRIDYHIVSATRIDFSVSGVGV